MRPESIADLERGDDLRMERKLKAILDASAHELNVPGHAQALEQAARRAGARPDQLGAAIEANLYWP
jgi:hypothetical protein